MSWNIDYNEYAAEGVYANVQKGEYLKGLDEAKEKLTALKDKLEELLFNSEWFADKYRREAEHYEYLQKQYSENPNGFSGEHAREVNGKSPQELYGKAKALEQGEEEVRKAIDKINATLKKIKLTRDQAEQSGKKTLDKIKRAIDLMDSYLRVNF